MEWQSFAQLSADALYALLRFRQDIFVVEQGSPYPDLDGLDQEAWHLRLWAEGELAGCLRLVATPGPLPQVGIGRVAVAAHLRWRGLGGTLMKEALVFCREHRPAQPIVLSAQLHLAPFYQGFGFAPISEPYDDFGVTHIEMSIQPDP